MAQKSAKDLAFDRERQKWNHRANSLKEEIRQLECSLSAQEAINKSLEDMISELTEENEKLRKLLDIPRDELNAYLKSENEKAEHEKRLAGVLSMLGQIKSEW